MPTIRSFQDIIAGAGAPTPLFCLDPAFSSSYSGSGQTVADLSGNANDFKLGTTSGSDSADPTFHGTGGGQSSNEYLLYDGGDTQTIVGTNPCQTFHKNNAVLAILQWVYCVQDGVNFFTLLGDKAATNGIGFRFGITTAGNVVFQVGNGTSSSISIISTATVPNGAWCLVGAVLDESVGANGGFLFINGTVELFNSTYTSPSASNSAGVLCISGHEGGTATGRLLNGSRTGPGAAFTSTLSQAQVQAIFAESGIRYGVTAGGDAALSGDGSLSAAGSSEESGAAALSGSGSLSASWSIPGSEVAISTEAPIRAISVTPIAAFEEPAAPEDDDLLRLNTSAVIDFCYLLELKPFAPAGTSLPV